MQFSIPTSYIAQHLGAKMLASFRAAHSSHHMGTQVIIQKGKKHATVICEPTELIHLIGHDNAELVWGSENLDMTPKLVDFDKNQHDEVASLRARWQREHREGLGKNTALALQTA